MLSEIYYKVISSLEDKLIEPIYAASQYQLGYEVWDMIARNCDNIILKETPAPLKTYSRNIFKKEP